jgi:LPXTG-motif cell wall-anchored protein
VPHAGLAPALHGHPEVAVLLPRGSIGARLRRVTGDTALKLAWAGVGFLAAFAGYLYYRSRR